MGVYSLPAARRGLVGGHKFPKHNLEPNKHTLVLLCRNLGPISYRNSSLFKSPKARTHGAPVSQTSSYFACPRAV